MNKWRLIVTPPASGSENMAIDEALWLRFKETGHPFLRFYTWKPAALSIGRFQNLQSGLHQDLFLEIPRVRRITGGGAIWHDHELTYSLGCGQEHLMTKGVKASFEKLTAFLLTAWKAWGWEAHYAKDSPTDTPLGQPSVACFAGKEEYDILVSGKKLGGNAQSRSRNQIFQHGSLPVSLDYAFLEKLFLPGFAPQPHNTTSLSALGWTGTVQELIETLADQFQQNLQVDLIPSELEPKEQQKVEELLTQYVPDSRWFKDGSGLRPSE